MAEVEIPQVQPEPETPQVPELNIDKPTENSKVITIEFEAKKTNKVSTKDTNQQLYTTDTDAWFEFKETSLEGANGTYSVVFRNRHDGSIFQRTGDVVNGVAYYKIPHQEIRHAGAWRGQVVYTLSNGDTTAREFYYDVKGHILDGKYVREIVVEDFETLMSQLRNMKDNAEQELAGLVNTANQNETNRQAFFDDLVEDIDELQANYQELLDTGALQTNINQKLEQLEEDYAPKLTEVTAQLQQTEQELSSQLAQTDDYVKGGKTYPMVAPHPHAENPVLTAASVIDRDAQGVADPFITYENGIYHMFFEIISASNGEEIGHAYSYDGLKWIYTQVVISESGQHFAYPFVMKYEGKWYMIPDKGTRLDVYEAIDFPLEWRKLKTIHNIPSVDGTLFEYRGVWYYHVKEGRVVNLYYSDDWLNGSWTKHPKSPILSLDTDRGAGRPFVYADCVILPMQGFYNAYGDYAKWVKLSNLSKNTVIVTEGPRFIGGEANGLWNSRGMHHMDHIEENANSILVVDGISGTSPNDWSIGIYTFSAKEQPYRVKVTLPSNQGLANANEWTTIIVGTAGSLIYDTHRMWDKDEKVFVAPKTGYYRLSLQAAEYSLAIYRNVRIRIYDVTNSRELCQSSLAIPAGTTAGTNNTLQCSTIVHLKKGDKITAQFSASTLTYLANGASKTFFEIEKID